MPINPATTIRDSDAPGLRTVVGATAAAAAFMAGAAPPAQAQSTDQLAQAQSTDQPAQAQSTDQPVVYQVRRGDSLSSIAAAHGLPAADGWRLIFDANPPIADPDLIRPGDVVTVPPPDAALPPRPLPGSAVTASGSARQAASSSPTASAGVWDRLARCESGGDWSVDGAYDGGLQFAPSTWRAHGGGRYAAHAHQASRGEQIAVAERVLVSQGWAAWPACSSSLGLR